MDVFVARDLARPVVILLESVEQVHRDRAGYISCVSRMPPIYEHFGGLTASFFRSACQASGPAFAWSQQRFLFDRYALFGQRKRSRVLAKLRLGKPLFWDQIAWPSFAFPLQNFLEHVDEIEQGGIGISAAPDCGHSPDGSFVRDVMQAHVREARAP